jgi:uncharacterized SAM-binding protein YcdF (DUF218 family)
MIEFSLNKQLGEALDPLAILWVLMMGVVWRFWKLKERKSSVSIFALWILVWCLGATPLPGLMLASLERPYVVSDWDALPKVDAVVCLGGGLYPEPAEALGITATDAFDRYLTGFDLVQSGKADHLVFGGSDYVVEGIETSEGKLLAQWKKRWGLINGKVHLLKDSRSTRDEAVRVRKLVESEQWESIYLVTSAWHMRRSKAVFSKQGVNVQPVGCDFKGLSALKKKRKWKIFPQSSGLKSVHVYVLEIVGYYYYKLRGWIA